MPLDSPAKLEYPLHWAVFTNEQDELKELLENRTTLEIDKLDPRGRTALMLAITIRHFECARLLMDAGADASIPNKEMWSVSNEAVAQGNEEFVQSVIHHRDYQRATRGAQAMRRSLEKLRDVPDFFCEMNWDFSSWVPFLSQACPSDCHKVYKKGSSVRIDTTLVSFEGANWVRGNQSYMFRLSENGFAEFIVLDHDERIAAVQELRDDDIFNEYRPLPGAMDDRLSNTISTTYIDVDNIGFERTSRGFLSWFTSGESNENVDGYDCKVLNASNVHFVTKRRYDHLTREARDRLAQEEATESKAVASFKKMMSTNKTDENTKRDLFGEITPDQYLDPNFEFEPGCDIGKPREVVKRSNAFKATLWMADEYPLNLHDQIIPIVELMAVNSPHFARLHKFIRLQLPAGFPVKIEIPLFHIVSARIAFQNVNSPGKHVIPLDNSGNVLIEDEAFEIPEGYIIDDDGSRNYGITWEDDDDRNNRNGNRSTVRNGGGEGRNNRMMRNNYSDEMMLQIAIEQSLRESGGSIQTFPAAAQDLIQFEDALPQQSETEYFRAIRDSQAEAERRRREEEQFEEDLRKVLELSKTEQ